VTVRHGTRQRPGRCIASLQKENHVPKLLANVARLRGEAADAGMTTLEYAVGTLAAVAFAGVLYKVVSSPHVSQALTGLIDKALK
jgi:hypothetical protein